MRNSNLRRLSNPGSALLVLMTTKKIRVDGKVWDLTLAPSAATNICSCEIWADYLPGLP